MTLKPIPCASGLRVAQALVFYTFFFILILSLCWLSQSMWLLVAHVLTSDFHYAYVV